MKRWLLVIVCVSAFAGGAGAQTLTGVLNGKVVDEQGGVLPGATVTLTGRQGAQTTVTDANGDYRFVALEPGLYEVKVELSGFSTRTESVNVSINRTTTQDLSLGVQAKEETITVTADSASVDVTTTATDNTLSQDLLFAMPISRSNAAVNILNNAPGINEGSAFGGDSDSANALLLDGVDTRDPEGGTAWTFFNYNIIEEVQVSGLGANAEYGGFTGAVVNTITKSGGNAFSGLFEMRYTNDSLASSNISPEVEAQNPSLASPNLIKKLVDYTVQLGGPIKRDKAFFFASIQRYSVDQDPPGSRTSRTEVSPRFNWKVTWQASPTDTIVGSAQVDQYNQTGRRNALADDFLTTDEIAVKQDSPEWIWNAQYRKVLGTSTFLEAKFTGYWGYFDLNPEVDGVSLHNDAETGEWFGGAGYYAKYDRTRNQVNASVSHYAQAFGQHNFKFGVEIERSKIRNRWDYVNGLWFYDYGGLPYLAYNYSYDLEGKNKRESFYAQDAWKFGRATANVGVRIDHIRGDSPVLDREVYNNTNVGPRLGLAYDVTGHSTSVLRAFWGRYYEGAQFLAWNRAVPGIEDFTTYDVSPNGGLTVSDISPGIVYGISDDMKHPRVDEFNLSFEHQLRRDMRFTVAGIWRSNGNFINSVIDGATWTPFTFTNQLTNEPQTAYRWANAAATEENYKIVNVDGFQYFDPAGNLIGTVDAKRTYKGLMLVFQKTYTNRWQAQASYVYSQARGTINNDTGDSTNSRQFETPNRAILNVDGPLTYDRPHEFKAYVTYMVPKIETSVNLSYRSVSGLSYTPFQRLSATQTGYPFSTSTGGRNVFLEPRGSRRNPVRNIVDMRFEKVFTSGIYRFGVYADVMNLFNAGTVTDTQARVPSLAISGFPDPVLFGSPSAVVDGRQVTFGGRWSF